MYSTPKCPGKKRKVAFELHRAQAEAAEVGLLLKVLREHSCLRVFKGDFIGFVCVCVCVCVFYNAFYFSNKI